MFDNRPNEHESYKIMEEMSINSDVIKSCVSESFNGPNFEVNDNNVLKTAAEDW